MRGLDLACAIVGFDGIRAVSVIYRGRGRAGSIHRDRTGAADGTACVVVGQTAVSGGIQCRGLLGAVGIGGDGRGRAVCVDGDDARVGDVAVGIDILEGAVACRILGVALARAVGKDSSSGTRSIGIECVGAVRTVRIGPAVAGQCASRTVGLAHDVAGRVYRGHHARTIGIGHGASRRHRCGAAAGGSVAAAIIVDDADRRSGVLIRQRVNIAGRIEFHQLPCAGHHGDVCCQRVDRHGLRRKRLPGAQHAARGAQGRRQVEGPKSALVGTALQRTRDGAAEVLPGVDNQGQRTMDIFRTDVGDADIVADGAGRMVDARVGERKLHFAREVQYGSETGLVGVCQRHLVCAGDIGRNLQRPITGRQVRQAEHGRMRRLVPAHRSRVEGKRGIGVVRHQRIVGRVEHAGRIGRVGGIVGALPHVLVEADCRLGHGQGHQCAIRYRAGGDVGRSQGLDLVDAVGLGYQKAPVGCCDQCFALRAARCQLQGLARGQRNHPHHALMRRGRATLRDGLLRQRGRGEQQAGILRSGLAESDVVDRAAQRVFKLGLAGLHATHRETDDVRGRVRLGVIDDGTGRLHAPQPAVRAECQARDLGIGEMRPGGGRIGGVGVVDLDAVARGDVDQACAAIDGKRLRERLAAGAGNGLQHGATGGIDLQQLVARGDPQLADTVDRHGKHGRIEGKQGLRALAAGLRVSEDLVAVRAGRSQHGAVGQLDHGHGSHLGRARAVAAGEALQRHGRQHGLQIARLGRADLARQGLGGLLEQGVRRIGAVFRRGRSLGRG